MSDKKTETSKKWRLNFAWADGIASARMSVTVALSIADPRGNPMAIIRHVTDKFGIPLDRCTEASAELVEQCSDDDNPF